MSLLRHFVATSVTVPAATASHRFRVITYNILANKFALGGHHSHCPSQHLSWTYRQPAILAELKHYDADVLCLQEVEQAVFDDVLTPWMGDMGFAGHFYARVQGRGAPEGAALFYRLNKFELIHSEAVRFSDVPLPGASWSTEDRGGKGKDHPYLELQEGMVLALLRHTASGRNVLAAATHLHWDPQYPDVKAMQAAALCSVVADVLRAHCSSLDVAVVIGGDFNSLAEKRASDDYDRVPEAGVHVSGSYQLMDSGSLPPAHLDHPRHHRRRGDDSPRFCEDLVLGSSGLQLHSTQAAAQGREPVLTTKTASFSGTLDYVFISRQHFQVEAVLEMPYTEPAEWRSPMEVKWGPIPDSNWPSDHLAMGADLVLL
ncbi:MAG: hypothetical protein WDW36_010050 [Sanguina aurantia]